MPSPDTCAAATSVHNDNAGEKTYCYNERLSTVNTQCWWWIAFRKKKTQTERARWSVCRNQNDKYRMMIYECKKNIPAFGSLSRFLAGTEEITRAGGL